MNVMDIVRNLGVQLPLAVVYLLGLVLAISQMQRLPRVAAPAGGGFGLLLVLMLVRPIVTSLIFRVLQNDPQTISIAMTVLGFFFNLLEAGCMGAIAYAIFADRPEAQLKMPGQAGGGPQPWTQGR